MELVIETLVDYIYAILNSDFELDDILYETAIHDHEGVKIRLPCNAFFVIQDEPINRIQEHAWLDASEKKTLHSLLKSPPERIYYCIGMKPHAYLSRDSFAHSFQVLVSYNHDRKIFEKSDIMDDLKHHCGFDDVESYTEEEEQANQKILMHHFKNLAKFANQHGYISLKRRKRASKENKAKVAELAALVKPLIDMRIANKPNLTKEGIVRLKWVIQEPLNIYRAKHPLARYVSPRLRN